VQANLKRYRAAVLKAAVEGRLVPTEAELARREGRSYEPASELLVTQPLLAVPKKAQAGVPVPPKPKYKEPTALDTVNLPKMPEGWAWATIDQLIVEPPCNGISVKGNDSPPGIAALKLNAMSDHGFDYSIIRYLPLEEGAADDLWILEGSLKLVGRGTSAQNPPSKIIFPDTMIRLRFAAELCKTNWIPAVWPSSFFRRQIERRVKTTAGIYKISQPQVQSIAVPLPPLGEQLRIVSEVERRLSVIDELEMQVEANLKRAERLRQAILKRAFEGKLVPQDPNDEPASMLLERIRNAKATGKSACATGSTATPGCVPDASDIFGHGRKKNKKPQAGVPVLQPRNNL
jgi:type I restriction enzyme S subunit